MPKLSGFDFLKTLTNPPKIIVTTAYKEFALEGYELNISDYLLKPFSFERFVKAINKTITKTNHHQEIFSKSNRKP
ncbi:response regulator [Tenacibaculum soleae]|uniref:LytR/AlgR family response regulator transcription factor n=1 Tax=Tenacibaculum soleae TaxID=447689 RepID=UPI0026E3229B|nr:response regulator [Tenacibaculum soleae]MDO6744919.1 response regulator [Tenacibaculum soleae]